MGNTGTRGLNRNSTMCLIVCVILIVYITLQFVYAAGFLPANGFFVKVFYTEAIPPPYIAFLASLLTPRAGDMDRGCLWRLFKDRNIMFRVEMMLENPKTYDKLQELVETEFEVCIVRNDTLQIEKSEEEDHPPCFLQPSDLKTGPIISVVEPPPSLLQVEDEYTGKLMSGGYYPGPEYCKRPRHSTFIIIPYRNRELHLRYWLHYTLESLIKQQLRFQVVVVEQDDEGVFNKGQLMNTGFKWAMENTTEKWDCFIFHDVDMISEIYGTLYKCADETTVVHLAPYVDKFNYTTAPKIGVTVGGAVGFTEWQYKAVNGYSNVYWGWGGEDDDMNVRIRLSGLNRWRPRQPFGRYKMIRHVRDTGNPTNLIRHKLLKTARTRMAFDGLSNLATQISKVELHGTHTKLYVTVNKNTKPPPGYPPQEEKKVL